ncbi:putative alpha-1,2-mannosyltransferase Mnn26p [[Candida] jaroonii]|uniref:Alpha-1,2-mannosyltransferase Mnn26p n=1 Tax=[Candida] jaroonii TaxID=467808 RepID=A0ACA9YE24_9ASCO|nr:putative alpha-1,2-mannosyltransferase Mnn26p [[Candida] jaroonii]
MIRLTRFQQVLALLIVILIAFNGTIMYQTSNRRPSLPAIKSSVKSIEDLSNDEIADSMTSNDGFVGRKAKLLREAIQQIKEEHQDSVIAQMKKDLLDKNEKIWTKEIKESLVDEYTKSIFRQDDISHALMEDLKLQYLKANENVLKSYISKDIFDSLRELPDFKDHINEEVIDYVVSQVNIGRDTNFFSYIKEEVLNKFNPRITLSGQEIGSSFGTFSIREPKLLTRNNLLTLKVNLDEEKFKTVQSQHDQVVKLLNNYKFVDNFYSGQGIVINANDESLGAALLNVIQIRDLGSTLPVEIIVNDDTSNHLCKQIFPKYNAVCKSINSLIKTEDYPKNPFFMKVLGIIVSSFDTVIALDSDNIPVKNVDDLLYARDFLTTEFVIWSDIWHKTTSPLYYDIARYDVGELVRRDGIGNDKSFQDYLSDPEGGNFHDKDGVPSARTSESGQLLVTKSKHIRSLILALYYNLYGPDLYYHLLYQGGPGKGDKETFIPALEVFDEPYHLVETVPELMGFKSGPNADGEFVETTLVQYHPTESKFYQRDWKSFLSEKKKDTRLSMSMKDKFTKDLFEQFKKKKTSPPTPFFLHIHQPKLNPFQGERELKRNLGKHNDYKSIVGDDDWELKFNSISRFIVCDLVTNEEFWTKLGKSQKDVCENSKKLVEYLENTSSKKDMGYHP